MSISDITYDRLIAAHEGRSEEDSAALNRVLILLLLDALDDEDRAADLIRTAATHPMRGPSGG